MMIPTFVFLWATIRMVRQVPRRLWSGAAETVAERCAKIFNSCWGHAQCLWQKLVEIPRDCGNMWGIICDRSWKRDCQIGSGKIEHLVNFSKPGIIRKDVCFFCCITFPWMNIELSQRCGYLPTGNTSCDVSLGIGSRGFGLQGSVGSRHLSASFKTSARRDARQM